MNINQEKIIDLAKKKDISKMKFREIARELKIDNVQTVIYHLDQLNRRGLLYFDPNKKQRVAKTKAFAVNNLFNIPIVGAANCGPALELAQDDILGYLKISQKAVGRSKPYGLIAVRAVGNSLNKASIGSGGDNIEEGDYVIVDCSREPVNGSYVLSIIDGAANFKKYYKNDEEIRLISESTSDIPPIILHEDDAESTGYLVNGVVVRVIKN